MNEVEKAEKLYRLLNDMKNKEWPGKMKNY